MEQVHHLTDGIVPVSYTHLYFLTVAGVVNVIFNLFFVIVLHMGVAGVALATIIAQAISAGLILLSLEKSEGVLHLRLKELSFHKDKLFGMLPVSYTHLGLQNALNK